jgi:hypothetical protein
LEETPKVKLTPAERLELKVRVALEKRDRLLEVLTREILDLEARLAKARDLRGKLGGGEVLVPQSRPSATFSPPVPLKGFRSNGRAPATDPIDALIREGKIG